MLHNYEDIYFKAITYPVAVQLDDIAEALVRLQPGEEGNLQLFNITQELQRVFEAAQNSIYSHLANEGFHFGDDNFSD